MLARLSAGLGRALSRGAAPAAAPRALGGVGRLARAALSTAPPDAGAAGASGAPAEGDVIWPLRHVADEMPAALRRAYSRQNMCRAEIRQLEVQEAIKAWERFPGDTGSYEVQVAIFTQRIQHLATHMKDNHKDMNTKRRLQMLVYQRNRALKYMRRRQREAYDRVMEGLQLRPTSKFDPTLSRYQSKTAWAAVGDSFVSKKRRKRARPYGFEKSAKGRNRLRKNATQQRRLQKERAAAVEEAAVAERLKARDEQWAARLATAARDRPE